MMLDKATQVRRARTLIATLGSSQFYGEVIFKYEHGNIVFIELSENKRMTPEQARVFISNMVEVYQGVEMHPVKSRENSSGASLVRLFRKGSLEDIIPSPVIESK